MEDENQNAQEVRKASPVIGDALADGTVYAGISPDTQRAICVLPEDASVLLQWEEAMEYAANYEGDSHGAGEFRLPTKNELTHLFEHRAAIGNFNDAMPPPIAPSQSELSVSWWPQPQRSSMERYFNTLRRSTMHHAGRYWSSTEAPAEIDHLVWTQAFHGAGEGGWFRRKPYPSAIRLVHDMD